MDVYGLIGFPLEHSFSKNFFLEKFRKDNIQQATFELFPLKSIAEFNEMLNATPTMKGLAVTIPYKVSVIPFLSDITGEARAIGAVNCIQIFQNKLIGHNTDAIGFEKSFLPLLTPDHQGALILGDGGAAKAVKFVLKKSGLPYCTVLRKSSTCDDTLLYKDLSAEILHKYPVIINCTPVGMHPLESEKPAIPYHLLSSKNLLYDLIYNPEETVFLHEGKRRGCKIKNGFEMLCLQAEENWKIWAEKLDQ